MSTAQLSEALGRRACASAPSAQPLPAHRFALPDCLADSLLARRYTEHTSLNSAALMEEKRVAEVVYVAAEHKDLVLRGVPRELQERGSKDVSLGEKTKVRNPLARTTLSLRV